MKSITMITSPTPGPTSMILAGVHGNETCGVDVLKRLLPTLTIERGTLFLGFGNPKAIEKNVRQTDANLNRMFKDDALLSDEDKNSYEYARAQELKRYLDKCEYLLDIHASTTPQSKPFAICEPSAAALSRYLPLDLIVGGFDAIQPGGTDYYMNRRGKIGLCVECGYLGDATSSAVAEACVWSFLKAAGHIAGDLRPSTQTQITMNRLYYATTDRFTPAKEFEDFETIAKGQCLGTDGDKPVVATEDGIILFANATTQIGAEALLLGKKVKGDS